MSNKSPAFQFYPKEYLASEKVQLMDLAFEGPYLRALCYCWLNGSIPSDPEQLARLVGKGCSIEAARVVQGCFNQHSTDPLRLVHNRLDSEREKQRAWGEKSAFGGKKSAEIRKKKAEIKGGLRVVEPKANIAFASAFASPIKEDPSDMPKVRERDPIWDVVVRLFFPDGVIPSDRSRVGKVVRDLKSLSASEEEINIRFRAMRSEDWGKHAGPEAMIKNWSTIRPQLKRVHVPSF